MPDVMRKPQSMRCVLCGWPMLSALVFIAGHAVGPVCARRAGLVALAERGAGSVTPGWRPGREVQHETQMEMEL